MTGKALDNIKPIPGESFDAFRNRVHAAMFADIFSTVDRQNEASVRRYIDKGDLRYAVKLMKEWLERKLEDVEVLRTLKAYLIEKRVEVRAVKAGYARTYCKNKRAKRAASDIPGRQKSRSLDVLDEVPGEDVPKRSSAELTNPENRRAIIGAGTRTQWRSSLHDDTRQAAACSSRDGEA